ncbi:hypothetical protein [Micromonospora sp. NPDC047730]|uniref:hypothetical protein n=1 Tax=Micromonospora sp. NPDC047730 TaxID=3364253 RepID=UPI003722BFD9
MTLRKLKSGDVIRLTRDASPQFVNPIRVRVIRVLDDWHTYDGWKWLDGYQLGPKDEAVDRRTLFVRVAGVQWLTKPAPPSPGTPRRPLPRARMVVG